MTSGLSLAKFLSARGLRLENRELRQGSLDQGASTRLGDRFGRSVRRAPAFSS